MYYKLGQACVTNCGSFVLFKLGQTLLQMGEAILEQALQIRAVIANWGIAGLR